MLHLTRQLFDENIWETEYVPYGPEVRRAFTVKWKLLDQIETSIIFIYRISLLYPCISLLREWINFKTFQISQSTISIAILLSLEKNKCQSANHIFKIQSHLDRIITTYFKGKNELGQGHDMGKWCKPMYFLISADILYSTRIFAKVLFYLQATSGSFTLRIFCCFCWCHMPFLFFFLTSLLEYNCLTMVW